MYNFKNDEVIVLLGAGASVEAGIPHSADMISRLESLINGGKWNNFQRLYNYIKSSIHHSSGIQGKFTFDNYNIETLVNNLDELVKKHEHTLYPFVGAWNPTLVELAGNDFSNIKNLKEKILDELRSNWLAIENENLLDYYQGLIEFRDEYQFPLRIFSLNYDRCLEVACQRRGTTLELGFNKEKIWNWRRFTESNEIPDIYFYKLHGSIEWKYEKEKLTYIDAQSKINHDDAALIFGTSYKLQYRDPFLFLVYEFRKFAIEAKLIVCIGYGFGDEHINKIIHQALVQDKNHLLLSVSPFDVNEDRVEEGRKTQQERVAKLLDAKNSSQIVDQIICREFKAKRFLTEILNINYLSGLFPEEDAPFVSV